MHLADGTVRHRTGAPGLGDDFGGPDLDGRAGSRGWRAVQVAKPEHVLAARPLRDTCQCDYD